MSALLLCRKATSLVPCGRHLASLQHPITIRTFTSGVVRHRAAAEMPPDQAPSQMQKLKQAFQQYGSTVVAFHVAISLTSLGICYLAVSSGLDMVALVSKLPYIGQQLAHSNVAKNAGTFVLAYAVHKALMPVRVSITLTSAPFLVKFMRAKGWIKK